MSTEVTIIGSGMAGLGAAHRLGAHGVNAVLFDAADHPGGHTHTHHYEGDWLFDEGPHVSFTKDSRIRDLLADSVEEDFRTVTADVDNYWRGYRFKHPAIRNLAPLPNELIVSCIEDFVEATSTPAVHPANYAEWLNMAYGRTFARTFPMEYAKKVHTTEAENLTTDWLGPRLYRPELAEVLHGALTTDTPDVHYVTEYRYPSRGGFFAYLQPWLKKANLHLGHRLTSVDPAERMLTFSNGEQRRYERLISTVPLPDFAPMVTGAPAEVTAAAARLTATNMVLVNVGIDREDAGDTWTYFYDDDLIFTRVSYPASFSAEMCPPGHSSFQAEVYFSDKYLPLDARPESLIEPTISDLRKTGLISDDDRIAHTSALHVPYANIIHDHDKQPALELIFGFLEATGIEMAGRYGLWGYQWTDEAFITGEDAAQRILDRG